MQSTSIPAKFQVAWAANAATTGGPNGDGYRRVPPAASQIGVHDGYASFTDGFPPLTAQPVASGGVPPYVQDTNGVLNLITAWSQWTQAGGPVLYDAAFGTGISGYPKGALLISTTNSGITWQSTVEGNTSNPDGSSPTGWVARPVVTSAVTVLPLDAAGNGGSVILSGSNGATALSVANYQGRLRVASATTVGFDYNPAALTLTIGSGAVGRIAATSYTCAPDINGNRVFYFVNSGGAQTGHIIQDNSGGNTTQAGVTTGSGAIHINATGTGAEVVVDASGGLTATSFNASGGAITNANSIATTAAGGGIFGTAGIVSRGPVAASGELDVYGSGIKMFGVAYGTGGPTTAQVIYNTTSTKMTGTASETELWCDNGLLAVDGNGTGYLRGPLGGSYGAVKTINTSTASERRLKRDVAPLTDGLAALMAAPPIRFRYKEGTGYDPAEQHVGHFYEELRDAMPEAALLIKDRGQADQRYVVPYLHSALLEMADKMAVMQARMDLLERRQGGGL